MSANQTLMCIQNAQQLHADIIHLNEALAKKVHDYPEHEQLCSMPIPVKSIIDSGRNRSMIPVEID